MDSTESKRFKVNGFTAYVVYYIDGDCGIEIEGDDAPDLIYDAAWEKAEELGLIDTDSNGDFGDNT